MATTPVDQKVDASYDKSSSTPVTGSCCDLEEYFCLYTHQIWTGPNTNDVLSAAGTGNFGVIRSDDWPLIDGTGANAKVVGRVQGQHTKNNSGSWNSTFDIVFQDDKFKGSSLQVKGPWVPENPFEYSILGGTGQFTLAQGIVYGKTISVDPANDRMMQLCFQVFYRPIQKPNLA